LSLGGSPTQPGALPLSHYGVPEQEGLGLGDTLPAFWLVLITLIFGTLIYYLAEENRLMRLFKSILSFLDNLVTLFVRLLAKIYRYFVEKWPKSD